MDLDRGAEIGGPEHAKVLVMVNKIMMSKGEVSDLIRKMVIRDIGDTSVMRRVNIIQLSVLSDSGKVSMVYPRIAKETDKEMQEVADEILVTHTH